MGFFKGIKKAILTTVKKMGEPIKDLNDSFTHQIHVAQNKSEKKKNKKKEKKK